MNPFYDERDEWAEMLAEQKAVSDARDEWRVNLTARCIMDGVRVGVEEMGFEEMDDAALAERFEVVRDATDRDRVRVAVREVASSDAQRGAVFTVTLTEADGVLEAALGAVILIRDLLGMERDV